MNVFQSLLHAGTYALAFYALYVVAGSLAFGYYVWKRVYRNDNGQGNDPVPVRLRDRDPGLR